MWSTTSKPFRNISPCYQPYQACTLLTTLATITTTLLCDLQPPNHSEYVYMFPTMHHTTLATKITILIFQLQPPNQSEISLPVTNHPSTLASRSTILFQLQPPNHSEKTIILPTIHLSNRINHQTILYFNDNLQTIQIYLFRKCLNHISKIFIHL
jgi:hypothetical protein